MSKLKPIVYSIYKIKNVILQSCTYVIHDRNEAYLIDCGDSSRILSFLRIHQLDLRGIFLTHCHYDHIYGLNDVLGEYFNANVYCHQLAKQNINNRRFNLYFTMSDDSDYKFLYENRLVSFDDVGQLTLFNRDLIVINSAGHSSDSVSYLFDDNLFTGDAYNPDFKLSASWPNSDKMLAKRNEERLKMIIQEKQYKLYPGHWKN